MNILIYFFIFSPVLFFNYPNKTHDFHEIELRTIDEEIIPLMEEKFKGFKSLLIDNVKEEFDKKYFKGFFSLYTINAKENTEIVGTHVIKEGPYRLSVYEISKGDDSIRKLRVVASGYYQKGERAEFTTIIKKFSEHAFLVTAEKVESKDQLNSHLKTAVPIASSI